MFPRRFWIAAGVIAIVVVLVFVLSIPRAKDGPKTVPLAAGASNTLPAVTLSDTYRKGVHTLSGSVVAPDACSIVSAAATTTQLASSTVGITLSLSLPADSGVCLTLPTPISFSTTVSAPDKAPVAVMLNGVRVATTAP